MSTSGVNMPEPESSPWPNDLFDFAFIPVLDENLNTLKDLAEAEDWTYQHAPSDHPFPVLYNYVRYTYRRVAEESKIALSTDGQYCCFNVGVVTPNQEPIFASFEPNRREAM
jgi:hypothetical protein